MAKAVKVAGSEDGFSLTEMLVVLGIVGLLFSIALPSYRAMTRSTPAAVARQVLQTAQLTRLAALKAGIPKALVMDAEAKIIRSEADDDETAVPATVSFSATFGRDERTTSKQGSITFFPDGSATGGTISFEAAGSPEVVLTINWLTGVASLSETRANVVD